MDLLKAMALAALLTGCVAVVIGSQGTSAGQLAIYSLSVSGVKLYWSWPLFFCGTGLSWGLFLLQK